MDKRPAEPQSRRGSRPKLLAGYLYGENQDLDEDLEARPKLWQKQMQEDQSRLKKKYPIESLRKRLAYEERSALYTTDPAQKAAKPPGQPHNRRRLTERAEALRKLHQATAEEFISRPGFGLGRHPGPGAEKLLLLEPGDPLVADSSPAKSETLGPDAPLRLSETQFDAGAFASRAPTTEILRHFNTQSNGIFVNPNWLGYSESLNYVVGFVPHRFWKKPELGTGARAWYDNDKYFTAQRQRFDRWRNTRLQLVSLLKHPEPRVYLSENLPAMIELENAETRALDDFEQAALIKLRQPQLRGNGEVVVEATTNTIRMMGPLRTEGNCSDCHQVRSGSLLGAFSYVLERDPPISATKAAKKSR